MRFPVFAVHRTVGAGNSFPIDVVRFKKALTKAGLTVEPDPKSPSDHPGLWRDAHGDAVPRRRHMTKCSRHVIRSEFCAKGRTMAGGHSPSVVNGEAELRNRYSEPSELARKKCLASLDQHCRKFISLSPFLCIGTSRPDGGDVSPRGDAPGFVHVSTTPRS